MSFRILLIEDDPGLALTLSDLLTAEGYALESASDGETGLARASAELFDLVILDVMLPRKSGFDVCRELRLMGIDSAVIMLTAFDPAELLARVEALLRRVRKENLIPVRTFAFDGIEADFERPLVTRHGHPVNLATKEMQLFHFLVDHRERVVTREEILQKVWKYNSEVASRTIDVHIAWLRQKLEENPQHPRHIHTIRGKGYRFTP